MSTEVVEEVEARKEEDPYQIAEDLEARREQIRLGLALMSRGVDNAYD